MADKEEPHGHQGLICLICLDTFNNPTLLSCGHTFCKNCLVRYDEEHKGLKYMQCMVCKKRTKLGKDRVSGLSPNYLFKRIEDELHSKEDGSLLNFCSVHHQIYEDILCEDCEKFICLTCYVQDHQGHKIKKKEEIEADLKKKRDTVIQKSQTTRNELEKSIANAEENKLVIHSHLENLEMEIKDSFAKKVTILHENENRLLKRVSDIRKDSDKVVDICIARQRWSIDNINNHTVPISSKIKLTDLDTLKEHLVQFGDLESLLQKVINEECTACVKQSAGKAEFHPADETVLDLGHLQLGEKALDSSLCQHRETPDDESGDADKMESKNVPSIPAAVSNSSMTIVRNVELPETMNGMTALSQDTVVIGYGWGRGGTDRFSINGDREPHLTDKVGHVFDIAFLTDGRSVVSHFDRCAVYYTQNGEKTGVEYIGRPSPDDGFVLCSDQQDNVYVVNGNAEMYIFHGYHSYPKRVEDTKGNADQICVTKTGALITIGNIKHSDISVYSRVNGPWMCTSKVATQRIESMFAAVDCQDRVLIAKVMAGSDILTLTRYTLEGVRLIEQMVFKPLELPHHFDHCGVDWCYMVSLTPNLIAFASGTDLYFIQLPN